MELFIFIVLNFNEINIDQKQPMIYMNIIKKYFNVINLHIRINPHKKIYLENFGYEKVK